MTLQVVEHEFINSVWTIKQNNKELYKGTPDRTVEFNTPLKLEKACEMVFDIDIEVDANIAISCIDNSANEEFSKFYEELVAEIEKDEIESSWTVKIYANNGSEQKKFQQNTARQ